MKNIFFLQPQTLNDFYNQNLANPGAEYLRWEIFFSRSQVVFFSGSYWFWPSIFCRFDGRPLYKSIKSSPYRGRRSVERLKLIITKCFFAFTSQSAWSLFMLFQRAFTDQPFTSFSGWHEVQILRAGPSLTLPQEDLSSIWSFLTMRMANIYTMGPNMLLGK